jgi:hypothetical protein
MPLVCLTSLNVSVHLLCATAHVCTLQVEAYLSSPDCTTGATDVLEYWQGKADTWKKPSRVALSLLRVPASSTSSARSFSLAGRTLDDRRSQLSGDTVDGLLFLHGLK